MDYVIPFGSVPTVAVQGTEARFPVRRIYCVGRNYAAHVSEMGADPDRDAPIFFQKPADVLLPSGSEFPYPSQSRAVHHEIELVIALGRGGTDLAEDQTAACIYGYAVGIDMTRRDLQSQAKQSGCPWEVAKAFEHSAPISAIVPVSQIGHPRQGRVWLTVNGELRQQGDLSQLIWSVPEIIATLSRFFTLAPGDLIFTGTPAGVGPVQPGDQLQGGVDGVNTIALTVV